ncbi:MAG: phosphoglycerate kinase [Candidatus Woesearchaeota archaeon]|nr:phosphoglycerate kinase [Candidatus Woesearchaeota archaeon]
MPFLNVNEVDVENKRVFVRVGMDISVDSEGNIIDDQRIVSCIPTIQHLIDRNAKIILLMHIGRPKGVEKHLTTDNVAKRLSRMLFRPIEKLDACTGEEVQKKVEQMKPGDIIFLENVRFHEGETKNEDGFVQELAALGDVYVNECFSVSHREHASMVGVPKYMLSCGGLCLRREIDMLKKIMKEPEKPFVALLGGVKGDKINALKNLITKADKILIGGGLAFLFLKLRGFSIGRSKVDAEWLSEAVRDEILELALNEKIVLPVDVIAAKEPTGHAEETIMDTRKIHSDFMGLDIGPRTIELYKQILAGAKTVIWAGPMGLFEIEKYEKGTREMARYLGELSEQGVTTVIGGGESAFAVEKFKVIDKMTHVSTGGGAFLAFVANESLPAIDVLTQSKTKAINNQPPALEVKQ